VSSLQTILLYGGSFDPPHVAHLILPMLAMEAVGAGVVTYIPAGQAPHKQGHPYTPAEHRLAMLRLALEGVAHARIHTDEIDRGRAPGAGPSYTVETLERLRGELGDSTKLRLLIGADMLRMFDTWRQPARIVELAEPVVMLRPPETVESLLAALPRGFDPAAWKPRLLEGLPLLDLSATAIRRRIAQGRPISGMVTPAVERYIAERGLYR
jgi:nicotinate-nucleotide adenylyltransferase